MSGGCWAVLGRHLGGWKEHLSTCQRICIRSGLCIVCSFESPLRPTKMLPCSWLLDTRVMRGQWMSEACLTEFLAVSIPERSHMCLSCTHPNNAIYTPRLLTAPIPTNALFPFPPPSLPLLKSYKPHTPPSSPSQSAPSYPAHPACPALLLLLSSAPHSPAHACPPDNYPQPAQQQQAGRTRWCW